jgi:hypothetical protein
MRGAFATACGTAQGASGETASISRSRFRHCSPPNSRRARASMAAPGQNQPGIERPRHRRGLPSRRRGRIAVARGGRTIRLVGARVLPRAQGVAHVRRPRGRCDALRGSYCGSDPVPPRVCGALTQAMRSWSMHVVTVSARRSAAGGPSINGTFSYVRRSGHEP